MGLDWGPIDRLDRARSGGPDRDQRMSGCKEGAKWTAREFLKEAVESGAELLPQTTVDRGLTEPAERSGRGQGAPTAGWTSLRIRSLFGGRIRIRPGFCSAPASMMRATGLPSTSDGTLSAPL